MSGCIFIQCILNQRSRSRGPKKFAEATAGAKFEFGSETGRSSSDLTRAPCACFKWTVFSSSFISGKANAFIRSVLQFTDKNELGTPSHQCELAQVWTSLILVILVSCHPCKKVCVFACDIPNGLSVLPLLPCIKFFPRNTWNSVVFENK